MKSLLRSRGLQLLLKTDQVEASLWRRLIGEKTPACRLALFELNQGLARAIAIGELRRRPLYGLEMADILHLAYGGLLESIDRYDPQRGVPFDAYARPRIRGAIADGLSKASESSAQYSARVRAERERLSSLRNAADQAPLKALSDLAIGLALGFLAETGARRNGEALADPAPLQAYESLAWRELEIAVFETLRALPENERIVIEQHYLKDVPFSQIGALLNLSKGRISQLHSAALKRMRSLMKENP